MRPIRLGIFGCKRGSSYLKSILMNNGEVVALCDRDPERMARAARDLPDAPAFYTDFEDFLGHDMDAVLLANYFHEHAPYAIRCLDKGLHVLSECTANGTMAEGVALVRAAERSKAIYMLAENYPFLQGSQELTRVYRGGSLGSVVYAEGEYNHPFDPNDRAQQRSLQPKEPHWRNFLPRTYYITHSLAPLMCATGSVPVRVTALPAYLPDEDAASGSFVGDRAAIITCLNQDRSVFRLIGNSAFGGRGNSYRICGTRGQIEHLRGGDSVLLHYNEWEVPPGKEARSCYQPDWPRESRLLLRRAGLGAEYYVVRAFFRCIAEGRQPEFDVHFATTMASVGILAHRSLLEMGVPYDIPDFRREKDRQAYENDRLTPFPGPGEATLPCCSQPDYRPGEGQLKGYRRLIGE